MSEPTDKYSHMNHHHELDDDHELVDFGDGPFIANKDAIPLLKALNEVGLRTRTHHYHKADDTAFVAILVDDRVRFEVRLVNEIDATRTKYNGMTEVLIQWRR